MTNNNAKDNNKVQPNKVDTNAVYTQMYYEMRRYRDYEFTSSMWYTAILLAIVGFVASTRFANSPEGFAKLIEAYLWLKITIAVGAVIIAATSSYLICYAYRKYNHLRKWTDALEPVDLNFKPLKIKFTPRHIYYITQLILVFLVLVLLFIPNDKLASGVHSSPPHQHECSHR